MKIVVIGGANSPSFEDKAVLEFFETSGLGQTGAAASVESIARRLRAGA